MAFSIQTNVSSIIAQDNLRVTNEFQGRTISRLTSGYRINQSGDDAAGLAVANKFRSDISELMQGVRNANDGISTLQIVDGGLNNISKILDRLTTLATQSATDTFNGDRNTLNNEYQDLLTEIDRQASNIGLVANGANNKLAKVYIGGGSSQSNAQVAIDLSGSASRVDATSLGVGNTGIGSGGTALTGNTVRLDNTAVAFLAGGETQAFTFRVFDNAATSVTVTVTGDADGLTGAEVVDQLNSALSEYNINASIVGAGSDVGELQFGGTAAFAVSVAAASGGNAVATTASTAVNDSNYQYGIAAGDFTAVTVGSEVVTFANADGSQAVTLDTTTGATVSAAITELNAQLGSLGITAIADEAGTGISLQSSSAFNIVVTTAAGTGSIFGAAGAKTVDAPAAGTSETANGLAAVSAISNAITSLGLVQGRVGTAQNRLQQAINLAQSQVSSFSAAESRIRDADIAAEAANLTKAQVLQQSTIAALAQANSAPQAVLALLRG